MFYYHFEYLQQFEQYSDEFSFLLIWKSFVHQDFLSDDGYWILRIVYHYGFAALYGMLLGNVGRNALILELSDWLQKAVE